MKAPNFSPQQPVNQKKNTKFTLRKFTIYERLDKNEYLVIGSNRLETIFRILTINVFSANTGSFLVKEENIIYTRDEIIDILSTLQVKKLLSSIGFFGVIKFTKSYYLVCITAVKKVAVLGGHYMNHIESIEYLPLLFDKSKNTINEYTDSDVKSEVHTTQTYGSSEKDNETFRSQGNNTESDIDLDKKNLKIESKIMATLFDNLKVNKNFYFSYTYDLTNSLQTNLLREKLKLVDRTDIVIPYNQKKHSQSNINYNEIFIWNHHLLKPILEQLDTTYDWFQPIIHGFINQIDIPIVPNNTSNKISICIIARRSRKFAGLRFLKRGVNNEGYVANEVESEQIVSNSLITSFHATGDDNIKFYGNDKYTSFLQHRGSVPLNWSQDLNLGIKLEDIDQLAQENQRENYYSSRNGKLASYKDMDKDNKLRIKTKPPINIYLTDPYYRNAAKHFNDLFARYGGNKIMVLDLLKQNTSKNKKRSNLFRNEEEENDEEDDILKGRESVLGKEYRDCVEYLNQFLPQESQIEYIGFDMSKVSKQFNNAGDNKVIEFLEAYAAKVIQKLGVFQNSLLIKDIKVQSGIVRVSCQDCLDRTNASQFIIGKKALAEQLRLLKVLPEKYINENNEAFLEYDSLISNLYTNLYQAHGNTIALQYGSSHLVNTIASYRKDLKLKNGWRRESSNNLRDLMESFKRYYNNSFYDAGRQEAINIFLGVWEYNPNSPLIWDMKTDYYLHNKTSVTECDIFNYKNVKRSYRIWYRPEFLTPLSDLLQKEIVDKDNDISIGKYRKKLKEFPKFIDSYWNNNYDLSRYTDLNSEIEYNLFLDNCVDEPSDLKVKSNADIVKKESMKHGLFDGDPYIGKRHHGKVPAKNNLKGLENSISHMKEYDDMFENKDDYFVRLDRLKKFGFVDETDEPEEYPQIESFYEAYQKQAEHISCVDESVYMDPVRIVVNEDLYLSHKTLY